MRKFCAKLIIGVCAFLIPENAYVSDGDSPLVLVVVPRAEIRCNLDQTDPVDVRIQNYIVDFPRALYDFLSNIEQFELRTQFSELLILEEQIAVDTRKGFIRDAPSLLGYNPDAYLFASIDKGTDKVILRSEILDTSAKSLAPVSKRRIVFSDFLDDDLVQDEIEVLGSSLAKKFTSRKIGFISIPEYVKKNPPVSIWLGFAVQDGGDQVALGNVPQEIRTIPPHPDDVRLRPDEILPPEVPDNYLVRENVVHFKLGAQQAFDVGFSFWGLVTVAIRSSAIDGSGRALGQNHFRKEYIPPIPSDPYGGSALIFYSIEAKRGRSFSIPIYATYPILYFGKNKELIFRVVLGTNDLFPATIKLESKQGWDRFGAQENEQVRDIGKLKEVNRFYGIDIEGAPANRWKFCIQFTLVHTNYRENFNVPLSLQLDKSVHPAIKVNSTWQFWR